MYMLLVESFFANNFDLLSIFALGSLFLEGSVSPPNETYLPSIRLFVEVDSLVGESCCLLLALIRNLGLRRELKFSELPTYSCFWLNMRPSRKFQVLLSSCFGIKSSGLLHFLYMMLGSPAGFRCFITNTGRTFLSYTPTTGFSYTCSIESSGNFLRSKSPKNSLSLIESSMFAIWKIFNCWNLQIN